MHGQLLYIMYLSNVPRVSNCYFKKNKTYVSFREIARLIARYPFKSVILTSTSLTWIVLIKYLDQYLSLYKMYIHDTFYSCDVLNETHFKDILDFETKPCPRVCVKVQNTDS